MNKKLKLFFISLFAFILFSLGNRVQANSIKNISMDILVDDSGNAHITEIWNCNANKGTEVYHPYYNLGNSQIENLLVYDNGSKYTTLSSWNTSGTLESKANKCGINKISNGVELCWGISSYGSHTYTVKYTITNFVSELSDCQMIYWTLIPYDFSDSIGNVYIKIHSNNYIADTVGVWGYGNYGGTSYVYDGYIEMQSDGRLEKNEYMTILVKFPLGTFNTTNRLNKTFEYYYNMAEEGATHYTESSSYSSSSVLSIIYFIIFGIILNPIVIIIFISIFAFSHSTPSFNFGPEGKSIPKDVPYFRDIPCQKDLYKAYYISNQYGLLKNKTDLLGAIILKWLKDSLIRIEKKEVGMLFKKDDTVIVLNKTDSSIIDNPKEQKLFRMLLEASKDGILENKEFEKWCKKHYSTILSWFDNMLKEEKDKLVEEGLITYEEKTKFKIFKSKQYIATSALKQEALELAGLKRYLLEYTLIKDKEAIEVKLFEEYLIYAQMMGIAKTVAKEFKELYPDIIEESHFYSYDNIIFIQACAHHGISQATSAKARAESYSSGGGGFSSGGGGGGSFGGGGGGGGFR